jgi:Cu+-exporting ATPase
MKFIARHLTLIGILLLAAVAGAAVAVYSNVSEKIPAARAKAGDGRYTCPMHPQIMRQSPGDCPECAIQLVALSPDAKSPIQPQKGGCCGNRPVAAPDSSVSAVCPYLAASTNAPSCPAHPHP